MSKNRDKEADKEATRRLILDPNRPRYMGGANWLGHGAGHSDGHARVDELLLDGATMQRLEQERGGISSHFASLKRDHDLLVTRDANGVYRFDRRHLNLPEYVIRQQAVEGVVEPVRESAEPPTNTVGESAVVGTPTAVDVDAPPAERVITTVSRIVRDTTLANRVNGLHRQCCQLCGETVRMADGTGYSEGHHLQPLGEPHHGPDVAENIICVCPNHHAACDFGAILLSPADLRTAEGHVVAQRFVDYHNRTVYRGNGHVPQGE